VDPDAHARSRGDVPGAKDKLVDTVASTTPT